MPESSTQLLGQLLRDPAFRERFRRDPVATAREAGLEGLANELALGDADPMETLEPRESRSSLAGLFLAAALEAVGRVAPALPPVPQGSPARIRPDRPIAKDPRTKRKADA
jgi:hypothetical protein